MLLGTVLICWLSLRTGDARDQIVLPEGMCWRRFSAYSWAAWLSGRFVAFALLFSSAIWIAAIMLFYIFFCQLAPPAIAFTEALSALGQMLHVVNRKPLIDGLSQEGLLPVKKSNGDVSLSEVIFAYPSRYIYYWQCSRKQRIVTLCMGVKSSEGRTFRSVQVTILLLKPARQ